MIAVILAAGRSTRLRPLTDTTPKPMLPVAGQPMLERVIQHLKRYNITDMIITTHYCYEVIINHFGDGSAFGVRIRYAYEPTFMGTAGALKLIENLLVGDFLVVGGNDLLPTLDVEAFIRFHHERGGIGSIVFKYLDDGKLLRLFGQGKVDPDGRLVVFQEKPNEFVSHLVHTTYQCYSPRVFDYIPTATPYSIPIDLIPRLLIAHERIYGYLTESDFVCISTKALYHQANERLRK